MSGPSSHRPLAEAFSTGRSWLTRAVSDAVIGLAGEAGFAWIASGEQVLANSLAKAGGRPADREEHRQQDRDPEQARGHPGEDAAVGVEREGEQQEFSGAAPYKVRVGNVRGTRVEWRGAAVDLAARGSNNVARLELN